MSDDKTQEKGNTEQNSSTQGSGEVDLEELKRKNQAYERAMMDERRKRQEYEQQLAVYQQQLAQIQAAQQQNQKSEESVSEDDFWDNPQKFFEKAIKPITEEVSSLKTQLHYKTSELAARTRHKDFDDAWNAYLELEREQPEIAELAAKSKDPFEFAYQQGKTRLMQKQNDPAKLEAELRERIKRELLEEMSGVKLPRESLTTQQSAPSGHVDSSTMGWDDVFRS